MAHVSHKLKNSLEGALAGGGDPATSPLYVFGPFLRLIVVAGVAQVTFGASLWLVVLTIAVVSAMYRLVMRWVTDGSGGSGLSEEEFGSWAVKVNAAITFVEYTLTFLVSMAAMVTFIADRVPVLNEKILWIQYRTIVAIALSVLTGWLVNRGPKVAARTFGPATAGVLILLWAMVIGTLIRYGFHLPDFNLQAFRLENFHYTLGGYVRILAVMTGIEVFANLVAAYDGEPHEKSRRAFNSLLIIMGTTAVTMLIVGPAILELSDPTNEQVSVFTQTMDQILPAPLPLFGTFVGIAVLMSASAASAQGLQNLALGLRRRRYIPPVLGHRNEFDVADKPVWIEVGIVAFCFLIFGTHEETYLAIYAAGVFILLSMTGWAVTKRLLREVREEFTLGKLALIVGTVLASLLTTGATVIIFEERFLEGAWTYFVFIPILYGAFTYFRNRLGAPSEEMDYLGMLDAAQLAGFGFGQMPAGAEGNGNGQEVEVTWQPEPIEHSKWREQRVDLGHIILLLDGSRYAAQANPAAEAICLATGAKLTLLSAVKNDDNENYAQQHQERETYLQGVVSEMQARGVDVDYEVCTGPITEVTKQYIEANPTDLVVISTRGKSGSTHWVQRGASHKLIQNISTPVLLMHANGAEDDELPKIKRILVALDGSIFSERTLPFARAFAKAFDSELVLLAVPAVPELKDYRAPDEFITNLRDKANQEMNRFLEAVARSLREDGLEVRTLVQGSRPDREIVAVGEEEGADLIMMTSRGRGGVDLLFMGSVADRVVQHTESPVFMVPVHERPD
ncbi:MAG: universal stress protein [Anaerolineales bacterium]|nr:universal stress protein [Anaerolineales bacterium]